MSYSAAYNVAYYIANTLGKGVLGVNIFCNDMQDTPDFQIVVYGYGGSPSRKGFGSDAAPLEYPAVQVCVRDLDPSIAETVAISIHKAFDELVADTTINSTVYTWLNPMQPPFLINRDPQDRVTIGFNMEIENRRT